MKTIHYLLLTLFSTSLLATEPEQANTTAERIAQEISTISTYPKPPEETANLLEVKESPQAIIRELERQNLDEWKNLIETEGDSFVSHQVKDPKALLVNDAFQHKIYYRMDTKEYWILRTGGYGGVYQVYGPGKLDET